ncbi:MAG: hypothetical protein AAFV53_02135 [Myxococcota bacterium]
MMRLTTWSSLLLWGACAPGDEPGARLDLSNTIGAEDCDGGFGVGQCPADFTLIDADGGDVSLSDSLGQPTLVIGAAEW